MTLLVRDEESIVQTNIDYHLSRGVDFIIATDNRSVDRTPAILKAYERAGVLRYIYEPTDDYSQDIWVTRMAHMAADEFAADWVIHVDADEFWWPTTDKSIKEVLAEVESDVDVLVVSRSNFVALAAAGEGAFYQAQLYREQRSMNTAGQPLPPKVCHRASQNVLVDQGNHGIQFVNGVVKSQPSDDMLIFHYPIRGYAEFERKILLGGAAYERNSRLPSYVGNTWRELYAVARKGGLRDFYDSKCLSQEQLDDGLSEGELIHDPRLAHYLEAN